MRKQMQLLRAVLAAALCLILAACGGSTAADGGAAADTGDTGDTGADTSGPIRLGYVISDWTELVNLTGDKTRDPARDNRASKEEMEALVQWANDNGGVDGREIVATAYTIDQLADADERLAECTRITEDGNEQVVIDVSIFTYEADWSCFAEAEVAYLGIASATDTEFLASVAPYIATTWPTLDRQMAALVAGLQEVGFFDGATFGVLLTDDEAVKRNYDDVMVPALADAGVTPVTKTFTTGDQASMNNALLELKREGVDRIFLEGTIIDLGNMTAQAAAQDYHPRYAFSDYQAGVSVASTGGPPDQLEGSVGVSFLNTPSNVVSDNSRSSNDRKSPWTPAQLSPGMKRCNDILTEVTGRDYSNPGAAGAGPSLGVYCNNFLLWLESAREIGASWTPDQFGDGLKELGTSYQSTQAHATDFSEGTTGGPVDFRVGEYDASCRCYVAVTDYLPLPEG